MTLNSSDKLTAVEVLRRADQPWPFRIIECIDQTNQIMLDAPVIECNHGAEHTIVQRATLAGATARTYYQGTKSVATRTTTVNEPTGGWQALSKPDEWLANDTGNPAALRKSESVAIMKKMGTDQARDFIYGQRERGGVGVDGNRLPGIDGFATRLNSQSVVDPNGMKLVYSMSAAAPAEGTPMTSVYIVAWGEMFSHIIYPQHWGTAGVKYRDMSVDLVADGKGGEYPAYRDLFECRYGLAVEDPRSVIRICNIQISGANAVTGDQLVEKILNIMRRKPEGASTYCVYANYSVQDLIDKASYSKSNVVFETSDPWGRMITMIRDGRLRTMEAILDTEEYVA